MTAQHNAPAGAGARGDRLGGGSESIMADRARQCGLFPEAAARTDAPSVWPFEVGTRGRAELAMHCPGCGKMHRHRGLGLRRGPCGARYYLAGEALQPPGGPE